MSLTELLRNWLVSEVLTAISNLRGEVMASFEEIVAKLTSIQAGLEAVAADVQRLHDALAGATDGLTAEQAESLSMQAQAILDRVGAIDAQTPEA